MTSFLNELKDNRRLRLGLMAVFAIIWLLALLELNDHLSTARMEARQLRAQIARVQTLAKDSRWPGYRDRVTASLAQFRARAWREESEGRIQAHLQDWLREQLFDGGIEAKELVVSLPQAYKGPDNDDGTGAPGTEQTETGSALPSEMRLVHARLVIDFREKPFLKLMAAIADSNHWLWVERLAVHNWGTRTVELELGALFVIGPRREGA